VLSELLASHHTVSGHEQKLQQWPAINNNAMQTLASKTFKANLTIK